ncbi:MAG: class I SAM-dependent methyltransferase [Cyanobacteria bacterium P01_F01_bin.3]
MSYADVVGHHSMVFDEVRNSAYLQAMADVVSKDTVVMDLGAGLGVHGLNAAKLGAKAVHLVEPAPILEAAKRAARDSGLNNIYFHECRAELLELDAQVDVIVSVFTGNFLLTEDLLPSLFRARDRFLAPGGKLIPDRAIMEVAPVTAQAYYDENINRWRDSGQYFKKYGAPALNFGAIREYAANYIYYDRRETFAADLLAPPHTLMELDMMTATNAGCDSSIEMTVQKSGLCHGWLGWFQMRLGEKWLTTAGEREKTHWTPVFLPLEAPVELDSGESMQFSLKRPEQGEWTWTTVTEGLRQRQSTFLSQPIALNRLHKASDAYEPTLSRRGEASRWLLQHMNGKHSVLQLAEQVREQFPDVLYDHADAIAFTKSLADQNS